MPFQNNFNFNTGTKDATVWNLNVEPVIPVHLTEDWNLITRTIVPIINQPALFSAGDTDAFGLGDINPTAFLSPAKPGKFIWGVGPDDDPADRDRVSTRQRPLERRAGRRRSRSWTARGWSACSPTSSGTSPAGATSMSTQFLVQPFVNYNLADGWYLTSAPIITANFSASGDNHWTVPVGGGGGKLTRVGKVGLPIEYAAAGVLQRRDARVRAGLAAALPGAVPVSKVSQDKKMREFRRTKMDSGTIESNWVQKDLQRDVGCERRAVR